MSFDEHRNSFSDWLDQHVKQGNRNVPSRLVTVLGLLQRLSAEPKLDVDAHLTKNHQQLIAHDEWVAAALKLLGVESAVVAGGRRANNVAPWATSLFDWLADRGFDQNGGPLNNELIAGAQRLAAERLATINEDKPLLIRRSKHTTVAIIKDILDQAQTKKRAKDVAEYLVGAKLQLKFGERAPKPKNVNTPNQRRPSDFHLGTTAIEVTVSPPDGRHIKQIKKIVNDTDLNVWLLVRRDDREKWQNVVDASIEKDAATRVVVTDLETFLGQNLSERGSFDSPHEFMELDALFAIYHDVWLPKAGTSGLKIVQPNDRP